MSPLGLAPVEEVLELNDITTVDVVDELYDLGVDGLVQEGHWRRLRVVAGHDELKPDELVLVHHLDQHYHRHSQMHLHLPLTETSFFNVELLLSSVIH